MSLGLGKKYWVHVLKHFSGNLDECLEFMSKNKPINNKQWYELRPYVNVKKDDDSTCDEYGCDLVEEA